MKKIIIHAYAEQNLGDDMFVKYLCDRYSSVNFYLFCKDCYGKAFNHIRNLTILNSKENIFNIDFDLQIIVGGSIFMQSINKSILKKYLCDRKMKIPKTPTYIIGANFGPYRSKFFFFLYKKWFKSLDGITFRDEQSYNLFSYKNISWAPDILFNYKLPDVKKRKIITISCIKKNLRSGLEDYDENVYIQKLASTVENYSAMGFSIILAAFSKVQEDDVAANMIYSILTPRARLVTEILVYLGDIGKFLEKILSSAYIIGTRFHSIILGWHAGIPTFPICYNNKLENAIVSYEYKGNYTYINKMDEIDFSYIDLNRNSENGINNKKITNNATGHFFVLDKFLKEE